LNRLKKHLESDDSRQWLKNNIEHLYSNQQIGMLCKIAAKYGKTTVTFKEGDPNISKLVKWLLEVNEKNENPFPVLGEDSLRKKYLSDETARGNEPFPREIFIQLLIMLNISLTDAEKYIKEAYPYEPLPFYDWRIDEFCYHCCLAKGWDIGMAKKILDKSFEILASDIADVKTKTERIYVDRRKNDGPREAIGTLTAFIAEKSLSEIERISLPDDVYTHVRIKMSRFLKVRASPYEFFPDCFEDGLGIVDIYEYDRLKKEYVGLMKISKFLVQANPNESIDNIIKNLKDKLVKQSANIDRKLFIELLMLNKYISVEGINSRLDDTLFASKLNVTQAYDACVYEACKRAERENRDDESIDSAWNYYVQNVREFILGEK
jgi:hypothetical protein